MNPFSAALAGTGFQVHISFRTMTKLQKFLGLILLAATAGPACAQIAPLDLATIQSQSNAIIQQQNIAGQLNNLQLQQNIMQDRIREQQLFNPQLSSSAGVFPAPGAYLPGQVFVPDATPAPSGKTLPQVPPPAPAPKAE